MFPSKIQFLRRGLTWGAECKIKHYKSCKLDLAEGLAGWREQGGSATNPGAGSRNSLPCSAGDGVLGPGITNQPEVPKKPGGASPQ